MKWISIKSGKKKGSTKNRKTSKTKKDKELRDIEQENSKKRPPKKKQGNASGMLSVLPALGISRRGELSKEERKKKKDRSKEKAKSKEMTRKESDRTRKKAQVRVTQAPKSIRVTTREVDEENVKHLVAKFKLERQNHSRLVLKPDLDDKAKILMDRVNKKPYPIKYVTQGRQTNESLLADEASSFFRPSAPRKVSSAGSILQEDCYDYTPNLDEVLILPDENVYRISRRGAEVPYWAEKTEPDEEDTKDVDVPISVGSEHVELYHDKKLTLKSLTDTNLVLDEMQPMEVLTKRDDVHFHPHLVFSNTIRSLINVQQGGRSDVRPAPTPSRIKYVDGERKTRFVSGSPTGFVYSRIDPIQSAKDIRVKTFHTTTTSCE